MNKIQQIISRIFPSKQHRHKKRFMQNIHGKNNIIEGDFPQYVRGEIYGNNNRIIFGKNLDSFRAQISIGIKDCPINNCEIVIGEGSTAGGVSIQLYESDSYVHIGKGCMFSSGVSLWCSDSHSIQDFEGNLLNIGKSVEIGNHVWVGMDVKIGKNVKIADNSVVGWGSVVTKKFEQKNVIIAGNPAQIVKENIKWNGRRPQQILNKKKES